MVKNIQEAARIYAMQEAGRIYAPYREPIKNPDGTWTVFDVYPAGFLISRGHSLMGVVPATELLDHFDFLFSPGEGFEADIAAWERNGWVQIQDFMYGLHVVRKIIKRAKDHPTSKFIIRQQARENTCGRDAETIPASA